MIPALTSPAVHALVWLLWVAAGLVAAAVVLARVFDEEDEG